ncbi:hypothetical protein B0H13DRAFT_2450170 [Mycena leptocephala]|nr:hypothetical protein B0H13DRAFT_2450170 [Mycena leptocephala]
MALVPLGIFVFFTYAHSRPVPPSLHAFKLFCVKGVSAIEATFSYIWIFASSNIPDLATHLSLHGWQCFKVLLALAGHTLWILLPVRPAVRRLRTSIAGVTWSKRVVIASLVVSIGMIASVPGWRFLFWIPFYIAWGSPRAHQIDVCIRLLVFRLSSFVGSHPIEMSMLLGPAIFHIGALCLWKMLVTLPAIPSATKGLIRNRFVFGVLFLACEWQIISCQWYQRWFRPNLREPPHYAWLQTLETWISTGIKAFLSPIWGLQRVFEAGFRLCLEMWASLCWTEKLLIVLPAVVFYAHLYLIPPARRLWRIFCQWRRRLQ